MIRSGKINILIDGQFGSTGKGLMASYISGKYPIDIAVSNASANAGHTAVVDGRKIVAYHLPISGILNKNALIYLCAGSIIDPNVLQKEMTEYDIDPKRVIIHPRAAIIEKQDLMEEGDEKSAATRIASTRHGVGQALARKITRRAELAEQYYACEELDLQNYMDHGLRIFMEVPQGYSLGLNSGLSYPYCTSREISVAQALSDAQVHPSYLGAVTMTIRTYPIRVGNIMDGDKRIGWSGPWYPDQREESWEALGLLPEITTVTKRPRRIATFSHIEYARACWAIRPDFIFLNFVNYLKSCEDLKPFLFLKLTPRITYFGIGPTPEDVYTRDEYPDMYRRLGWL